MRGTVYLRTKRAGGERYLYLVRSVWDPDRRTSRQKIVKYLGNARSVSLADLPPEFAGDPRIREAVFGCREDAGARRADPLEARASLYRALLLADLPAALDLFRSYSEASSAAGFFEGVLVPVMREIGDRWAAGRLSIATEHLASNTARDLVAAAAGAPTARGLPKVLVCSPVGEEHCLGCGVIEAVLQGRGFFVLNVSPGAPAASILELLERERPAAVLVSVTLPENLPAARRLASKIRASGGPPVVAGGQAVREGEAGFEAAVAADSALSSLPEMIRGVAG